MEQIREIFGRLHADQSGAIALLCLASILILFMSALVIYDAGMAAQDKMDTQIGADTAAFSHSIVKARGMNVIAYANTIKRMMFSYLATYINAWLSILARWAYHASRCFTFLPSPSSCYTWFMALPMIIAEGVELLITNMPAMGGRPIWGGDDARARAEIQALENYSQYMFAITPWWAYVEGAIRGMKSGAMMTAPWPVPGGELNQVNNAIAGDFGAASYVLRSSARHVDVLPISRRDNDRFWWSRSDPYQFNPINSNISYCGEYALSLESIVTGVQTYLTSYSHPSGWKTWFAVLQALPSVGCLYAAWSYNDDGYTDWRLKRQHNTKQEWLAATGSLTFSYTPRAGRNADDEERQKYGYISQEAVVPDKYKNEGYFAISRSEIVYKQPHDITNTLQNIVGSVPLLGTILEDRLGFQDYPDMWSPRWKSRLRPVILPGEQLGSGLWGSTSFRNATQEVLPYLALGALVGIPGPQGGDPPFSKASAIRDFEYLYQSTGAWWSGYSQGIAK